MGYMWTTFRCAQAVHWAPQLIHRKSTGFIHSLGITSGGPFSRFVVRSVTRCERPQWRPQMLSTGCGSGVCTTRRVSNGWWEGVSPAVDGRLRAGAAAWSTIGGRAWGLQESSPHFCPQGYPQARNILLSALVGHSGRERQRRDDRVARFRCGLPGFIGRSSMPTRDLCSARGRRTWPGGARPSTQRPQAPHASCRTDPDPSAARDRTAALGAER